MDQPRLEPRLLKNVAKQLVQDLDRDGILWESEREDYVTSLVRQWDTYEAHATLFTREGQLYFTIAPLSPGRFEIGRRLSHERWAECLVTDWKIRREDLLDVFRQLNFAQRAEVVNSDGERLRLSVNAQTSANTVTPENPKPPPAQIQRDYPKLACGAVRRGVGQWLDPTDEEILVTSVVRQWRDYEGRAVLLLPERRIVITLEELAGGTARVNVSEAKLDVVSWLHDLGFAPATVPEVIRRLNTGEEIRFRDRTGATMILWSDARAGSVFARPLHAASPALPTRPPARARPLFCPQCSAVLGRRPEDQKHQTCPQCGASVAAD